MFVIFVLESTILKKTYSRHMKTHEDEDKVTSRDDENQPGTSRSQIEIYVC